MAIQSTKIGRYSLEELLVLVSVSGSTHDSLLRLVSGYVIICSDRSLYRG